MPLMLEVPTNRTDGFFSFYHVQVTNLTRLLNLFRYSFSVWQTYLKFDVASLKQNLNSNDRLKDIHTKLSEIRSENLADSGHMTELKTEVDDCKKIIKFLETEKLVLVTVNLS
jgi:hypothetical protein